MLCQSHCPCRRGHQRSTTLQGCRVLVWLAFFLSSFFFYLDFIYLFMRDTEKEAETQAEGEAGSLRGPRCGTRSQDPGITPWTEGRCSTAEPPERPRTMPLKWSGVDGWTLCCPAWTEAAVARVTANETGRAPVFWSLPGTQRLPLCSLRPVRQGRLVGLHRWLTPSRRAP